MTMWWLEYTNVSTLCQCHIVYKVGRQLALKEAVFELVVHHGMAHHQLGALQRAVGIGPTLAHQRLSFFQSAWQS